MLAFVEPLQLGWFFSHPKRDKNEGMFGKFKSMLKMSDNKSKSINYFNSTARPSSVALNYDWSKGLAFDNVYPSVSKIASEFMTIRPFAIDANGKRLEKANVLDKIYHPNLQMSGAEFREALATMVLTHRKAYLLVWHYENGKLVAGGDITEENCGGFTFLQDVAVTVKNGVKYYKTFEYGKSLEFNENEVVEISAGIDPYDLYAGYAPTLSAKKWANLDDYIASYQAGFFENGAVPAGQFTITAPTIEAFNEAVDSMQRQHRGSGNNNNVVYVHRPVSLDTGTAMPAQVEWTPFAQTNQSLSLKEIFDQVNDKIDSAFGVPASIRGVNDNNTYASVKVDERIFIQYTIRPFATKIWTKFTHEMNRIAGGLKYAITFDLEEPNIADEDKVDAERKLTELNIIATATGLGYSLDSVVDAFGLSNSYKLLELGEKDDGEIINDKPDVDEGGEVEDAPNSLEIEKSIECHHKHEEHLEELKKIADKKSLKAIRQALNELIDDQINGTLEKLGTSNKAIDFSTFDTDADGVIGQNELAEIIARFVATPTDVQLYNIVKEILGVMENRMAKAGNVRYAQTIKDLELSVDEQFQTYKPSAETLKNVENLLAVTMKSFSDETTRQIASSIAVTVSNAKNGILDVEDLQNALNKAVKEVKVTSAYRVERIAVTEEHRANTIGQIDACEQLEHITGATLYKVWQIADEGACEFCKAMNGESVRIEDAFVPVGGSIELEDGTTMFNRFGDMQTPQAHPNCRCTFVVRMEK